MASDASEFRNEGADASLSACSVPTSTGKGAEEGDAVQVGEPTPSRHKRRSRAEKLLDLQTRLALFSSLPPEALISREEFAALLGVSLATFDRRRADDPSFPATREASRRRVTFQVGDVRAYLASRPERPRS